jgi:hypothetical protein
MLGSSVRRIEHCGSFACRNVYGRDSGRRSQRTTADALDVAGFVLEDGRRIAVASHRRGDDERAAFLRSTHRQACGFFDSVFGPGYNAAHADHLHLDRRPHRLCRCFVAHCAAMQPQRPGRVRLRWPAAAQAKNDQPRASALST